MATEPIASVSTTAENSIFLTITQPLPRTSGFGQAEIGSQLLEIGTTRTQKPSASITTASSTSPRITRPSVRIFGLGRAVPGYQSLVNGQAARPQQSRYSPPYRLRRHLFRTNSA